MIRVQTASGPIVVGGTLRDKTISLLADAPTNPAINDVWYDLSTDTLKRWSGSAWVKYNAIQASDLTLTIAESVGVTDRPPAANLVAITYDGLDGLISGTYKAGDADKLDGKDSTQFVQTTDIGNTVQAFSAILNATTASFTTALKNKLDAIEAGATGDQTAAEILALLLTVDGAGSGLDADLLDGLSSSAFMPSATQTVTGDWNSYTDTGFYMGSGLTNNTPYKTHASWQYTMVIKHNSTWSVQMAFDFNATGMVSVRHYSNGTWGSWIPLGFGDRLLGRRDVTATTDTLTLLDAGKVVRYSGGATTITIPGNSVVPFPVDSVIQIYNAAASGTLTLTPESGVTVHNNTKAVDPYKEISLRKDSTNTWVRVG